MEREQFRQVSWDQAWSEASEVEILPTGFARFLAEVQDEESSLGDGE